MNKKVLIISSSPRKGGNSETLAAAFAKGAREAVKVKKFIWTIISVCQGRTGGGPPGRNCVSARKAGWLLQGLSCLPEVGALRHPRRCRRNCRQNA